jgi:transcriptional regulator with XRE-family HTH domain
VTIVTPEEIRAALLLKKITQASIAKKLGVSPSLVSRVIHGIEKNKRVQKEISDIIGKPIRGIWRK